MSDTTVWDRLRDPDARHTFPVTNCLVCEAAERGAELETLLREAPEPRINSETIDDYYCDPAYKAWHDRVQELLK